MNKFVLFLVLAASQLAASAQKNFKKATIKTMTDEIIYGYVNDKENLRNPQFIKFRETLDGHEKKLSAKTVKSISIENGSYYVRAIVDMDITSFDEPVENSLDPASLVIKRDTVFLIAQSLSKYINLYSYDESRRLHLYVQVGDSSIKELVYHKYMLRIDAQSYEKEDKTYQEQLQEIMKDCPSLSKKILSVGYSIRSMVSLFDKYNLTCHGTQAKLYQSGKSKERLEIGLLGGAAQPVYSSEVSNPSTNPSNADLLMKSKMSIKPTFFVGIRFNDVIPALQKKLSIMLDVSYSKIKGSGSESMDYIPNPYKHKDLEIDMSIIKFGWLFRYYLHKKNNTVNPFINAGLNVNYIASYKGKATYSDGYPTVQIDAFKKDKISRALPGFIAGLGLSYKRFGIEYRYETKSVITNEASTFSASIGTQHMVGLSCMLKK